MNPLNKFSTSNLGVLRAASAERANKDKLIKDLQRQNDRLAWQEKMRPLTDRLNDLLSTIPTEVKNAGMPISTLQERLKGRFRGQANIVELSKALRKLGYERHRNWRNPEEGYCSKWYPHDALPKKRSKNT